MDCHDCHELFDSKHFASTICMSSVFYFDKLIPYVFYTAYELAKEAGMELQVVSSSCFPEEYIVLFITWD